MADSDKKTYLDFEGLKRFLDKIKIYIADRISEINGNNVNAFGDKNDNPLGEDSMTISSQLKALWNTIGVGSVGSEDNLTAQISKVINEYVRSIEAPTNQNLPLKIEITKGADEDKDKFTISLTDNGLSNTLGTLTSNRVSKLEVDNDGGEYVTLSIDKNIGDVKLTIKSKAITEKVTVLDSNIDTLNTNLSAETTNRTNADNALDERLSDVEEIQSDLANQIQALSLGMKVTGSASPSIFFKGYETSVTVTATVQNKPDDFVIEEIKIGGTNANIDKGSISENVKLSGITNSKSWNISAKVNGIPFIASASVSARYPIFYGMDVDKEGAPESLPTTIDYSKMSITSPNTNSNITDCKLKRDKYRTSARGYSYEKLTNDTDTLMNFFVLVPSDVSQPTGFTMGGTPFVMDNAKTKVYTIDGVNVTYYIYKSGGAYRNGGSVTLGLTP